MTTTDYLSGYVYENDKIQFAAHEEGRIRASYTSTAVSGYFYDYFIKDHLGNVRMVLTEEQQTDAYPAASMENVADKNNLSDPNNYIPYYSNTDYTTTASLRTLKSSIPGYPTDTYTTPNDYVAKTNGNGNKIGPGKVLRVMAGDKFNIRVSSWYNAGGQAPAAPINPLTDLLSFLATGIAGADSKFTQTELSSSNVLSPGMTSFLSSQTTGTGKPKAYVNWVLFDEQFKMEAGSSGFEQVGASQVFTTHLKTNLPVNKNGYLYIYVSNETPNMDVYFDNLQVTHTRGPLLEETHYYPFGLTMAGISSKAQNFGNPENKIKFQRQEFATKEFIDGSGVDMYEFKWRMHDPQIGRFWQTDPLSDKYVYNSTYAFSENKVTAHVELEGLESFSIQDLWRSAGITNNSDPKQFVKQVGKELTKPKTWVEGYAAAGQIAVPLVLTTIMTGGFGEGAVLSAETNSLRLSTTTAASDANLAARATELQGTLPLRTQKATTTAVASATTSEGNNITLVASSETKLRTPQIQALKLGEIPVEGKGHAEITILNHESANGMQVNAIAASRPICAGCAIAINNAGAVPASPLKVYPMKPAVDATYVKPPIVITPKQ